jgi:hypothetical protein
VGTGYTTGGVDDMGGFDLRAGWRNLAALVSAVPNDRGRLVFLAGYKALLAVIRSPAEAGDHDSALQS